MDWYTRRRLLYAFVALVTLSALVVYFTRDTLFPAPTCTDTKQNGYETGIDCGGTCALRCKEEVSPLTVTWSRALKTASSTYDFVAMVSNRNLNNASHVLGYSFTAYNVQGGVMQQLFGTSTAPVDGDFPIIIQNVYMSNPPASVTTQLFDGPHFSTQEKPSSPTVRTAGIRYEAGVIPRVYATIINTKRATVSNLRVRVLLYDSYDNVYGAGETLIPFLDKETSRAISFTWNMPFKEAPTNIRVYPIFDPFSPVQ